MKPIEYIKSKLDELVRQLPQIQARYQFYVESDVHYVEIMPNIVYSENKEYIIWEESVRAEFNSQFDDESVCFVSENAITGISNPDYVAKGHKFCSYPKYSNEQITINMLNEETSSAHITTDVYENEVPFLDFSLQGNVFPISDYSLYNIAA